MSLYALPKFSLVGAALLLTIGMSSLALSVERPLTEAQWTDWQTTGTPPRPAFTGIDDPASRSWDYQTYLAAKTATNHETSACGFVSMNGEQCALGGMIAPINWLGLIAAAIGVLGFARAHTHDDQAGLQT